MIYTLVFAVTGCGRQKYRPFNEIGIDSEGLDPNARRLLFAQIVDHPALRNEAAILEGKAFKYLLKRCSTVKESSLKKQENKDAIFEHLIRQPNLFRGEVAVVRRAVVVEVLRAKLPPEYGLPGWTVLPALLVNNTYDLYELRILCPPGSKMYDRLAKGIREDRCPVLRVSGFFMKNHVKRTSDPKEPPWQRPLLVCPEPSIERRAGKFPAMSEIRDAGKLPLLPSVRIKAPKAEERLVVEVMPDLRGTATSQVKALLRVNGRIVALTDQDAVNAAVAALKKRLPKAHAEFPSGVVVRTRGAPSEGIKPALDRLRDAGLSRLSVKDEHEKLIRVEIKK